MGSMADIDVIGAGSSSQPFVKMEPLAKDELDASPELQPEGNLQSPDADVNSSAGRQNQSVASQSIPPDPPCC